MMAQLLLGMLLRGRRGRLALLGLLLAVSSALPLAGPQLLRAFIDQAVEGRPIAALTLVAGAYVAVALSGQALAVTAAYGATELAWTVTNDLRGLLLRHTLELDLSFHGTHPPGELIERTDGDVTALSTFVSSFVMRIVGSATVTWNGRPVTDLAVFMVPPRTAHLPQVPRLFSESLADNVLLGSDPQAVDLDGALRTAVLETDLRSMPDGLATPLGARGLRLSGGQAQRVATARAVTRRPDLLVLDDVSSALDLDTERALWDHLPRDRQPPRDTDRSTAVVAQQRECA
jgi:ABC-type multidrug transport system fused ATPase/permease subunit